MARMTSTPAGTTRMSKERVDFAEARAYGLRGPAWDDGKMYYFLDMTDVSNERSWRLRLSPEEVKHIVSSFINVKAIAEMARAIKHNNGEDKQDA